MDAIQSMSSNMSEITSLFTFHNLFVRRSKLKLTWCLATYRYTCPNQEITGAETGAGRKRLIRGWMKVKRPAKEKRKKNVYASDNTTRTTGDIPDGTQAVF